MRNHALVLVLILSVAGACSDDKSKGGRGGGGGGRSGKVDKTKIGAACQSDFECGNLDLDLDCSFTCVKPRDDDKKPGYCRLSNVVSKAGTTGCYGNRRGAETSWSIGGDQPVPQVNTCDIDAGVFCNMGTHACDPVKAIGAACEDSDECGKDGACQNKLCVAAGAPGAAPVEGRCASAAFKKGEQCLARAAEGGACEESDECLTFSCVYGDKGVCGPRKRIACPL